MDEIQFTQGDKAVLTLYAQDAQGNVIDLTGATFVTRIAGKTAVSEFDDSKHAIVDAAQGKYTLTLDASDTADMEAGAGQDILTTITIASAPYTYRRMGALTIFGAAAPQAAQASTNIFLGAAL